MNNCVFSGNLAKDSVYFEGNEDKSAVCYFTLACGYRVKVNEEWQERADYVDCAIYGNRAAAVHSYLTKGTFATVQASARSRKRGENYDTIFVVDDIDFITKKE